VSAEGIVKVVVKGEAGAIVEINSETDFVAKNDDFRAFAEAVAQTVIDKSPSDLEALKKSQISGGSNTVEEALQELFLRIRENLQLRRFVRYEGLLVPYTHGDGQIGVIVQLETENIDKNSEKLLSAGKDVALQIAALNPTYLSKDFVPAEVVESEKEIARKQIAEDPKNANKPANVIENNIIPGKINAFYKENCLLEQTFVKSDVFEGSVGDYIAKTAKDLGGCIKISNYVRFERGEGIEKRKDDFAAEVANLVQ